MSDVKSLGVYLKYDDVEVPEFGTQSAACFDVRAYLNVDVVKGYNCHNEKVEILVRTDVDGNRYIELEPMDRLLIPTGLIFDIPDGHSIRFHPRSGLSLKNGVVLGNMEAVIDSDYTDESMVILTNQTTEVFKICHGDRICQGELVENIKTMFTVISDAPTQKTDRVGGFGSTGKE